MNNKHVIEKDNHCKCHPEALAEVANYLPVPIYWKDTEGRYLGYNHLFLQLFGLPIKKGIIGRSDYELFSKEIADRTASSEQLVIKNRTISLVEEEFVDTRGNQKFYIIQKAPIYNEKNMVMGIVGFSIDITSVKLKEITTKNYLENVLQIIPSHIFWMDKDGKICECNEQQARTFGLKVEELRGKNIADVGSILGWPPEVAKKIHENDLKIMDERHNEVLEEKVILNGEAKYYLTHKCPLLDEKGAVIRVIGNAIDITDRKRAEMELKNAKEAAEAANARIKAMAGSIAHELRTPLGTIGMNVGCIESITSDLSDEQREIVQWSCQEIRKEAESANTIINMLLMNIREQLDWQKDKMEVCSMNHCIEEALRRYPFVDHQKEKVKWIPSDDYTFKGNSIFMQHVLFNLIKNALLQIAKAGKGEITIWTEKETEGFSLHFKDTASGVPKEILPHMFERFFSRTKNGTGLGLAFCKMVIESFGGTIKCQSEEGQYTEFVMGFSKEKA